MIRIKHFLDKVESEDRDRIWVEPIGVTKDLVELCSIRHVLSHLGPPVKLWTWFGQHPEGYEEFRARYHEHLNHGPYRQALQALAAVGLKEDFTLLHQGDDPARNTATALYEFLIDLQAYVPPSEQ
jgi:uncharacterized protein YeaO (DUF488 family)